jgi:hypothetical protein
MSLLFAAMLIEYLLNHVILIDLSIKFENDPALIYPFIRYPVIEN